MPRLPDVAPDERANVRREYARDGHHPGFERASDHIGLALPERRPELVRGVLRQGHKLMLAAQSKAGKTWTMIGLALAIANGYERLEGEGWRDGDGASWLGRECRRGEVVLFDGEMDTSSLWHRIDLVAKAMWPDDTPAMHARRGDLLHVRSLRGDRDITAQDLLGILDEGFGDTPPAMVIIDPIYKLLQGDENSNSEMRDFLKATDSIAAWGAAVGTSHHHGKGRAGERSVIDRAAGAGAFARDPDAFIDLNALDIRPSSDAWSRLERMLPMCEGESPAEWQERLSRAKVLRASYVLREFPDTMARELLFDFPIMTPIDGFSDVPEEGSNEAKQLRGAETAKNNAARRWDAHDSLLTDAMDHLASEGVAATRDAAYEAYAKRCEDEGETPISRSSFDRETKPSGSRLSFVFDAVQRCLVKR